MQRGLKRVLDVLVSAVGLVLLLPLLAATLLAIRRFIGKPAIFAQQRGGLHGKPFVFYKFRTMRDTRAADGQLLPDSERLTPLGRFLRRTSIDEIPQLWNVLKGDMSLVGPRPLLVEYVPLYDDFQRRRHLAKPGITGWTQVNGRNALSWDEKFEYDVWYVEHSGLWLDVKVVFMTFLKLLDAKSISHGDHATMPAFGEPKVKGNGGGA